MSDFEIECCGIFLAKRFRVKPYLKGVLAEEFTEAICPKCGQLIIERFRTCKKENGSTKKSKSRLIDYSATFYLIGLEKREIFNTAIDKGCKSFANWFFGRNNKRYDLNGKRRQDYKV